MNKSADYTRESTFLRLLSELRQSYPDFKAADLKGVIAEVNPEFSQGLFSPRPYVKTLRYIGCRCNEAPCPHGEDDFFQVGEVYQSIDFTGATYSIAGYGDKRIGSAHFEEIG